eukprot:Colp12_sorted_trinity150504_noHs@21806
MNPPLPLPGVEKMAQFSDESLFYIFYSMPRDVLQVAAAHELYAREWRLHKALKLWFCRLPGAEPSITTNTYEKGTYLYFDVQAWRKVQKSDFMLEYDQLEDRPPHLPPT